MRAREFATTGTTGEPVRWTRTAGQIHAEARLLAELCGAGIDGIACYAPPAHLYGYLMGRALPELLGVPCRQVGLTDPPAAALAGWRRPLVVALPASFAPLVRAVPVLTGLDRLVVVHSSAALPPAAGRLLGALDGTARLVELFGSTETGLIGWRHGVNDTDWTLAADVWFGAGLGAGVERLRVRSPRLARRAGMPQPAEIETDDLVRVLDGRTFRWLGRRSRLVKVNGRRVNLDHVHAQLADAVPDVAFGCRPERDELRGEWFSVCAETADPRLLTALEDAARALPPWQRPRIVEPLKEPA
ncbi:MAG TPA: hypothetical protein VLJ59_02925 [Mycobacteriales bacterium]|nr:hypothetical protein [Mycobacteriales bacterium]